MVEAEAGRGIDVIEQTALHKATAAAAKEACESTHTQRSKGRETASPLHPHPRPDAGRCCCCCCSSKGRPRMRVTVRIRKAVVLRRACRSTRGSCFVAGGRRWRARMWGCGWGSNLKREKEQETAAVGALPGNCTRSHMAQGAARGRRRAWWWAGPEGRKGGKGGAAIPRGGGGRRGRSTGALGSDS